MICLMLEISALLVICEELASRTLSSFPLRDRSIAPLTSIAKRTLNTTHRIFSRRTHPYMKESIIALKGETALVKTGAPYRASCQ